MSDPTTAELIAELSGLLASSDSPLPWSVRPPDENGLQDITDGSSQWVADHLGQDDAALIVALVNAAPALLDRLEHATSDVQQLSAQLLVEQERRAIAEGRVERLERALGPFALQSARMLGLIEDGAEKLPPSKFTTADLQRAVDALSETTDD